MLAGIAAGDPRTAKNPRAVNRLACGAECGRDPAHDVSPAFTPATFVPMMAPAMTTPSDERLAFANLARQGARVERRLPAASLQRLAELAPGIDDVQVELEFRLDGSERPWVRGRAAQVVDATCQRCLERFEFPLSVAFDLCMVAEGGDVREIADQADVLVVDGETVAIADIVEDELLLGLPDRLCREDPCPYAPALSYPAEVAEVADTAERTVNPFSVLSKLKRADS